MIDAASHVLPECVCCLQTRSGPPVETAMSGNHGNPGPPPGIAMHRAPTAPSTLLRDAPPLTTSADTPDNEDGHAAESQPSHMDGCYRKQLDADSNHKPGDESVAADEQQPGPLHQDPDGGVPIASPLEALVWPLGTSPAASDHGCKWQAKEVHMEIYFPSLSLQRVPEYVCISSVTSHLPLESLCMMSHSHNADDLMALMSCPFMALICVSYQMQS